MATLKQQMADTAAKRVQRKNAMRKAKVLEPPTKPKQYYLLKEGAPAATLVFAYVQGDVALVTAGKGNQGYFVRSSQLFKTQDAAEKMPSALTRYYVDRDNKVHRGVVQMRGGELAVYSPEGRQVCSSQYFKTEVEAHRHAVKQARDTLAWKEQHAAEKRQELRRVEQRLKVAQKKKKR